MKTRMKLFYLTLFFLFSNYSKAQNTTYPILSMDIQTIPISDTTTGGIPDLSDSTIFSTLMHISLYDTLDIDKIYVNLGDGGLTSNRLQHSFDWDVSGSTGNGTSYSRAVYNLTIGLGNFMGLLNYDATVSIKRMDGSVTDIVNFSR